MKIVLLTESLGSGGAERQVCTLAGKFSRRGHSVCVATYAPGDFYEPLLERERIEHRFLGGQGKVSWTLNVRRFLSTQGQHVVLALLPGPSAYAELSGFPRRPWGLVVSERLAKRRSALDPKLWLHRLADYVITNSHANRLIIERRCPWLAPKLVTIYNGVRIAARPGTGGRAGRGPAVRLVVAARFVGQKNLSGLIRALADLKTRNDTMSVVVDWFGDREREPEVFPEAQRQIANLGLEDMLCLHPPTRHIHEAMAESEAVLLPSFYEGLPNSVCEGMALGKPILTSDVCDARNLVEEGVNGFLFDPHTPSSIADAIARFARLTSDEKDRMGRASRAKAEVLFDVGSVADRYLRVLEAAAARKDVRIENWPEEVPDSALRSISDSNGGGPGRG